MKRKRGDIREDGMIFWERNKNYKNGEYWVTLEQFEKKQKSSLERHKLWSVNNRKRARVIIAKYAKKKGREWLNEKNRRFYRNNKHVFTEAAARRKAMKKARIPADCDVKMIRVIYSSARRISKCTGIRFDVDHIVPFALGGFHEPRNLQPTPAKINNAKSGRVVGKWPDTELLRTICGQNFPPICDNLTQSTT